MSPAPMWKESAVVARGKRHAEKAKRKTALRDKKDEVRVRDGRRCRFPLCGCGRLKMRLEVSHARHEGRGGNPAGDRSDPHTMVQVCAGRHKESRLSIDQHTIRWEGLTDRGSDGPIRWLIDMRELMNFLSVQRDKVRPQWFELARETGIGTWEPFTAMQREVLDDLARFTR